MCLYSKLILNRKYTATKKNGGKVPPLPLIKINGVWMEDERVKWVAVGCGKCMECMRKKSREWSVRLQEEIRENKNGIFVTLTFSDESINKIAETIKGLDGYDRDNEIARKAVRWFLERWRKKHKKSVRHWLVTELGHQGTKNIHLHGIIWTEKREDINKIWQYGFTWPTEKDDNYVGEKTINYITKYITKIDEEHKEYKPKIFCSGGIGSQYLERADSRDNKYQKGKTKEYYKTRQGRKLAIPMYLRNKIYTEEEKELLWIEKLNKGERWINGEKVKNEKDYYANLEHAQRLNAQLGYGTNQIDWERRRYEWEQRNLKFKQRIWKAKRTAQIKTDHIKREKTNKRIKQKKFDKSQLPKDCPF